ncbi:hypothetical protein H0H92_004519, partial [Tricholoma furcatifolium]
TWTEHHFTDDIQTRQYRCPEVILGAKWGPSADIWSVACVIFELVTGGDYLFDPAAGSRYSKDDDHIAQIMELLGELPKSLAFGGKYSGEFFNRKGELRHITKLRYWPLESVLHDKYLFPRAEADALAGFLGPMVRLVPEKRAKAAEMVCHRWLEGVVVQGEVDVVRRAERVEREEREAQAHAQEAYQGTQAIPDVVRLEPTPLPAPARVHVSPPPTAPAPAAHTPAIEPTLTQSEADAMKPIDSTTLEDGGASVPGSSVGSPVRVGPPPPAVVLGAAPGGQQQQKQQQQQQQRSGSGSARRR